MAAAATTGTKMIPAEPELDMAMVAAGKEIWEQQCMAACHTGKRGAIAPNIEKAYGTMRKLEGGGEILMDTEYVINSMNNPNEHIAKGYMPVMMKFSNILTDTQKQQVAAYLRSQGKEIMVPAPVSEPEVAAEPEPAPEPEPTMEAAPAPAAPASAPAAPKPAPAPAKPAAPAPEPQPAKPQAPAGTIFV
jgi:mono/diheme cytochrome c family protein